MARERSSTPTPLTTRISRACWRRSSSDSCAEPDALSLASTFANAVPKIPVAFLGGRAFAFALLSDIRGRLPQRRARANQETAHGRCAPPDDPALAEGQPE